MPPRTCAAANASCCCFYPKQSRRDRGSDVKLPACCSTLQRRARGDEGCLLRRSTGRRPACIRQHACSSRKGLPRPPWAFRPAPNDSTRADTDHLICRVQQQPASTLLASALRRLAMEVDAWLSRATISRKKRSKTLAHVPTRTVR